MKHIVALKNIPLSQIKVRNCSVSLKYSEKYDKDQALKHASLHL